MPQNVTHPLQDPIQGRAPSQTPAIRLWLQTSKPPGRWVDAKRRNNVRTLYAILSRAKRSLRANGKDHHRYNKGNHPGRQHWWWSITWTCTPNDPRQELSTNKCIPKPQLPRSLFLRTTDLISSSNAISHRVCSTAWRRAIDEIREVGTKSFEESFGGLSWQYNLLSLHQKSEKSHSTKRPSYLWRLQVKSWYRASSLRWWYTNIPRISLWR